MLGGVLKVDPYDNFCRQELILRDWLALDRTILANERTFLAYGRSALTLIVGGLAFVKFFGHIVYITIGYALISAGFMVFFFGVSRYTKTLKRLRVVEKASEEIFEEPLEQAAMHGAEKLKQIKHHGA